MNLRLKGMQVKNFKGKYYVVSNKNQWDDTLMTEAWETLVNIIISQIVYLRAIIQH